MSEGRSSPAEAHPQPTLLSDFILGSQDGLVNVLGILLGLVAAGTSHQIILVASLAALAAESISMGAVAYTTTRSRRNLFLSEVERERREMREVPEAEREEIRVILRDWGFEGPEVEEMVGRIEAKPKAWLEIMMAFELHLSEVQPDQARRSGLVVLAATVLGSTVPLIPFLVGLGGLQGALTAVVLSGIMLSAIGFYEARTTIGSPWVGAARMALIGLGAGLAGFLIGRIVPMF